MSDFNGDEKFSPEQQIVLALLRYMGHPNPEGLVDQTRLDSAALGAHLTEPLQKLVAVLTRLFAQGEKIV